MIKTYIYWLTIIVSDDKEKKSQATDSQNFVAGITQKKQVIYFHCGPLEIVKKVRKAKKDL